MDLSGSWRAATADDQLRRTAVGLHYDDADWAEVQVPGHWRNEPAFATSDGPVLLRTSENLAPAVIAEILDPPLPRGQARLAAARQRLVRALALA